MKPARSIRRWFFAFGAVVTCYTVAGFLILPPIVRSQLMRRLSAELHRSVAVEKVRINPYALSVTLENFAIGEREGSMTFIGWRRLYVNFGALASMRSEWVLSDLVLEGFEARGVVNPDQSLNFSDLLAKFETPKGEVVPSAKPTRPVRIANLNIAGATIRFSDLSRTQPFATVIGPLTFTVSDFRTAGGGPGAPYRFEAITESGEKLAWSGTLQSAPLRSIGELNLENVQLPKYSPYYSDRTQADLVAGQLSVRGHYEANLGEGQGVLKLIDGSLTLRGFKLQDRTSHESVIELPTLDIVGVQADILARKGSVRAIHLADGLVRMRRDKDGVINLLAMMQPKAETAVAAAVPATGGATGSAALPEFTIGELTLKNFQAEISDLRAPRPAHLSLSDLQVSLANISLAEGAEMPMKLGFTWAPQGTFQVEGKLGVKPVKADLKAQVAGFALLPLSPYLEEFFNAHISEGALTADLATQVASTNNQAPAVKISGDVQIDKFSLTDGVRNEDLAGFQKLALHGIRASTSPELSIAIDEIDVSGPRARVVVDQDKSLNLVNLVRSGASSAPAKDASGPVADAPAASPPKIEIGRIVVTDGEYRFTDRSVEPNVSMAINHFGGTVAGLSSSNPAKTDVDVKAMVDGSGPVSITGKLDPLGAQRSVDLKVIFKNVDLLPLSSYSGKYAGYELARGKLALDVKLGVEGSKIDSSNVVTLNQFSFGQAVKSADATSLPVRLGVALLKDMEGKIVIDVPVQGSTDDPNFRVGRVVLRVIVNLLTKVALSPFSLLGAAFGGGGEELAFQEFAPGSSQIQAAEIKKLQTMVQALTNRPGLSLSLEGGYDDAADTYAVKRVKLADQVRRAVLETKTIADPGLQPSAQLVFSTEENLAALKALYDKAFPPGTQFGVPLPPPPAVVSPPPPPPPAGFLKRIVSAITSQAKRDQPVAPEANERLAAEHAEAVAAALAAGLPLEEMQGRLAETMTVDENDLRALAQARAQQIRDYFITEGKISPDRLFLTSAITTGDTAKRGKGPRVFLQLQ